MADLGAIGHTYMQTDFFEIDFGYSWGTWSGTTGTQFDGAISGKTQVLGVDTGGITVRLYQRSTGILLSQTTSDSFSAEYEFTGLDPDSNDYYVLAVYPPDVLGGVDPGYNLARQDGVTPIE